MKIDGLTEIGRGMESTAYRLEDGRVLKVCRRYTAERFRSLEGFKAFYGSLDASGVPFALPEIHENLLEDGRIFTVEKFIPGFSFISRMKSWSEEEARACTRRYAEALLELRKVPCKNPGDDPFGYKRLSGSGEIETWNQLLTRPIGPDFEKNRVYFEKNVPGLKARLPALGAYLEKVSFEKPTLLHGDYCPENVLMTESGEVAGIIDFGFPGVLGDYLFDVATAWRFIDMYDQCQYPYKDWFMEAVRRVNHLSGAQERTLCAYILFYSLHSAGSFSTDLSDGHAAWCFKNLNNQAYWSAVDGPLEP